MYPAPTKWVQSDGSLAASFEIGWCTVTGLLRAIRHSAAPEGGNGRKSPEAVR